MSIVISSFWLSEERENEERREIDSKQWAEEAAAIAAWILQFS